MPMSRPRPPYLNVETTRHGKQIWYVRRYPGPRIRIYGDYGSPEFMAAYHAAIGGEHKEPARRGRERPETFGWLVARYRDSAKWTELSTATRRQRENILSHVLKAAGDTPFRSITKADIYKAMDKRADRASAANNFLATMKGVFEWAVRSDLAEIDPTAGVKNIKRPDSGGFHQWTEEEIDKFESRWPIGTRERLALAILLYTGLRRGDAAKLGKQHIKDGVINLRTEKTNTLVTIPVLKILSQIIEASPTGDLVLIAKQKGKPMTKEGFGNWFKQACLAAGVPGSCHGLRKAGATRCAEAGATIHELNAIFGWTGTQMASLYTEAADRARLAKGAMNKLQRNK